MSQRIAMSFQLLEQVSQRPDSAAATATDGFHALGCSDVNSPVSQRYLVILL